MINCKREGGWQNCLWKYCQGKGQFLRLVPNASPSSNFSPSFARHTTRARGDNFLQILTCLEKDNTKQVSDNKYKKRNKYDMSSNRYPVSDIKFEMSSIRYQAFMSGMICLVSDIIYQLACIRYTLSNLNYNISIVRYKHWISSIKNLVLDIMYQNPRIWYQVSGIDDQI